MEVTQRLSSAGAPTQPLDEDLRLLHQYRAAAFAFGATPAQVDRVLRRLAWQALPVWVKLWRMITR